MKKFFWGFLLVGGGILSVRGEFTGGPDLIGESVSTMTQTGSPVAPPFRPPLKIVHPPEGMALPAVKSSFVYGWADPNGKLTVNGRDVKIHSGGGWLTMIPYLPGAFTIQAELRSPTTSYVTFRRVTIGGGGGHSPAFSLGVLSSVQPEHNLALAAGETAVVQAPGPPGQVAFFQWGR